MASAPLGGNSLIEWFEWFEGPANQDNIAMSTSLLVILLVAPTPTSQGSSRNAKMHLDESNHPPYDPMLKKFIFCHQSFQDDRYALVIEMHAAL